MKRILVFVGLVVPAMLWAQSGVVARHPQGEGEKMLTMEEAVLGRNVRPSSVYARWTGPLRLLHGQEMAEFRREER